ncbi:MAG: hypothetical protein ACRD0K_07845 [Egibacteraceae bacterium]
MTQDGGPRKGAAVAEITEAIDLSGYPSGSRLIVRRPILGRARPCSTSTASGSPPF